MVKVTKSRQTKDSASIALALMIIFLSFVAFAGASNAGYNESETLPTWIVSTTETRVGVPFDAWLVIPGAALAEAEWTVTLEAWPGLTIWWRRKNENCNSSNRDRVSQELTPPYGSAEVLAACAESTQAGPVRLVALSTSRASRVSDIPPLPTLNRASETLLAASETVTTRPRFKPGPVSMAVLTALIGLVAGVSTQMILRTLEARAKKAESETSLQLLIGKYLFPELREDWVRIESYLREGGKAPILLTKGFNYLKGHTGAWGYLGAIERERYRERLSENLGAINAYNRAARHANHAEATEEQMQAAIGCAKVVQEELAPYFKEED